VNGADRALLSLLAVSKSFPGVRALNKVSLDVRSGEVHGLVGENGAGKSTLMAIASGALVADEGQVVIDGQACSGEPDRASAAGLSIVHQEPLLMPDLTVAENLYLGIRADSRPSINEMQKFAETALRQWSDDHGIRPNDRVDALSAEKRFIVEIVKATVFDQTVLILDEPTEHLAAEDVERLFTRIRAIAAKGTAVVYISHRLKELMQIVDRLTVLRDGEAVGTFEIETMSEENIVKLIVGKEIETEFPAKAGDLQNSEEVLRIRNFQGKGFQDVAFALRRGEILGLAGIDANGQREFLRGLAGLVASTGSVNIKGTEIKLSGGPAAAKAGISFVSGERHKESIVSGQSVRTNFSFRSLDKDERFLFLSERSESRRAYSAVARYAVKTPTLQTSVNSLSGGNQQKLVIAGALAAEPEVLLVDQPTQGVDVGARMEIYRHLRNAANSGMAIIVVSSDANEVASLCDRVMIFSRGRIIAELKGADVREEEITSAVIKSTTVRDRVASSAKGFWRWAAGDSAPTVMVLAVVLLMGLVAAEVNPYYLTPRSISGMLALVAILATVSYAQLLLMLMGGIDLSVGPLMGLVGVVGSYFWLENAGLAQRGLGIIVMIIVSALAGALNFGLIEVVELHPLIATLASYMGLQAVSLILRPQPGGATDFDILDMLTAKLGAAPVIFIVATVVGLGLEYLLFRSRLGISVRGHGSRPEAARIAGIDQKRMRLLGYVGCSLLAGLAGVMLIGQVGIGDPRAGISYTLTSIAAAVIGGASLFGGRGSFIGALLGSVLIIQVNQVAEFLHLDSAWNSYLLGAMIVGAVGFYSFSRKKVQV
jgi:ribose transport system ATP-binding protein